MSGIAWNMPQITPPAKTRAIEAVTKYLEDKIERHNKPLPASGELLALYPGGWKYGGTFPDSEGRTGYRITIRQVARVIHVHLRNHKIDRAHIIRKLIENNGKRAKLDNMAKEDPELSGSQAEQFQKPYEQKRLAENLNTLAGELTELRDQLDAGNRYEKMIFEPTAGNRFKYSGAANGVKLLQAIRDLVNQHAGAGTITGATGVQL